MVEGLRAYVVTEHARLQMRRRGISEISLRMVMQQPEQLVSVRPGRVVVQRGAAIGSRDYLIRVVVDTDRRPVEIVTVYRTSKVGKYRGVQR